MKWRKVDKTEDHIRVAYECKRKDGLVAWVDRGTPTKDYPGWYWAVYPNRGSPWPLAEGYSLFRKDAEAEALEAVI